jgi:Flp pilus assembly protein protease CpaA
MNEILNFSIPLTPVSLLTLAILCVVARWLAEVYAFHIPETMTYEWELEMAQDKETPPAKEEPSLLYTMQNTQWTPQAFRRHISGSRRLSGSQVDGWQLIADLIAVFVPFIAVFLAKSITPQVALLTILCWASACAIIIDRNHMLLPDVITLPLLWIGLLASTAGYFQESPLAIAGAAGGYAAIWLLSKFFAITRGVDAIGMGDAKWVAMTGAWFGTTHMFGALLFASLLGAVIAVNQKQNQIAFGPALAIASITAGLHLLN